MNRRDFQFLHAELGELNQLLSMMPESAVIDRMSLEYRRAQVEEELAAYRVPDRWPLVGSITFQGSPVDDYRGIESNFGTDAFAVFSESVALAGASQVRELNYFGPIPNREDYRLLITGVTRGSFGFEFEEAGERYMNTPGPSPVENGIEQVTAILKSALGGDEELANATADAHPRTLNKIREFLTMMANSQTTCALSFRDTYFGFLGLDDVKRSLDKLGKGNIREFDREVHGIFQGYLPDNRQAEIFDIDTQEVVVGRVSRGVVNAEMIQDILGQATTIRVRVRQTGNSRPRFTITDYDMTFA